MIAAPLRAGADHQPRRALAIALLGALVALLIVAPAAVADTFSPESGGSPNADDIDTLYWITLYIAIVIFVGVEGTLIYSLVKYRRRRGVPEPAQIRGNTPLEVGWTVGAALILVVLTAITFVYLGNITNPSASGPAGLQAADGVKFASIDQAEPPGGEPLNIRVNGQQYLWRYDYPAAEGEGGREGQLFSYYEMVVPIDTTVTLDITSQDVVHSWWIPELGGKADAVPGHTNETWFKISEPGVYVGQCAELCGENHADMRAQVRAVPVDEYEAWVSQQAEDIDEAQGLLAITRRQREAAEEQ
jgi:cytochrome c oxidase subunit 2